MKNSMNIVSATAGLAKIAKEHNASKLADDYRISLGFDYDKQKADKARILGCTTSSCNSLINVTKTLNNSKAVNHSPCYTVTYSLHSVNSVKLYIYFSSSTWSLLCAYFFMIILPLPSPTFLYYLRHFVKPKSLGKKNKFLYHTFLYQSLYIFF